MKPISDEDIAKGLEAIELKKYRAKEKRKGSPKEDFLIKIKSTIRGFIKDGFSASEIKNIIEDNFSLNISEQTIRIFIKKNKLKDKNENEKKQAEIEIKKQAEIEKQRAKENRILKIISDYNLNFGLTIKEEPYIYSTTHDFFKEEGHQIYDNEKISLIGISTREEQKQEEKE